jgi:hypothetical protein
MTLQVTEGPGSAFRIRRSAGGRWLHLAHSDTGSALPGSPQLGGKRATVLITGGGGATCLPTRLPCIRRFAGNGGSVTLQPERVDSHWDTGPQTFFVTQQSLPLTVPKTVPGLVKFSPLAAAVAAVMSPAAAAAWQPTCVTLASPKSRILACLRKGELFRGWSLNGLREISSGRTLAQQGRWRRTAPTHISPFDRS